ncbi:hypothetical protein SLS60_006290 [Paraconiothyrium brasiliense]|uniref:Uncharacterized protein n=1 Tax=Paraconiothyrium brasiliense TaxID=300254 RepID=A0ABR3RAX0_9PLEO
MFKKPGYDDLITALYLRGDPYETTDAVFGVKESLVFNLEVINEEQAREYGCIPSTKLIRYDFVLVPEDEAMALRSQKAEEAVELIGGKRSFTIIDGLPVPDVD